MSIRSLDFLDLPTIARYRNETLTLDSARALTRGHPLGAVGFISYFNPARHIYAALANGDGATVLGGIIHSRGEPFAKLLYLTPESQLNHPEMPQLLDALAMEAGKWGVFHILAELNERSEAYGVLRKAGFAVYAWQRVWDISHIREAGQGSRWKRVRSVDLPAVQSLYYQIVPPLIHPVEPAPRRSVGFVTADGITCYSNMTAGTAGTMLTPLIHPEVRDVSAHITGLVNALPDRGTKPIYMCVRSYQTWLEPVLEDLGAQAAERQAIMVKRLAQIVHEEQPLPAVPSGVGIAPSRVTHMDRNDE